MKRIAFFIESLAGGGAEKALVNLVRSLDKQRYDVTVYTVTDEDVYQDAVSKSCNYHSFLHKKNYRKGGAFKLLFWLGIKLIYKAPTSVVYRLFVKEKYDIEVAFVEGFSTKLVSFSSNPKSKKIAWVHIDTLSNQYADNFFTGLAQQIDAYRRFAKVIFVSGTVQSSFEKKYHFKCDSAVIHNLVDKKEIIRQSLEYIDITPNNYLQLVTVGRLEEQKGYKRLMDVLAKIDNKDYSLWIVGDGSQRNELERMIREYRLENNVKLIGFQKNPYKYMLKADAFVCSSYAEGYSTVITECLLLGKPVFTVECSGVREQLKNGEFGRIVPNTDDDLCRLMNDLINQPSMIEEYKRNIVENDLSTQKDDLKTIERLFDE